MSGCLGVRPTYKKEAVMADVVTGQDDDGNDIVESQPTGEKKRVQTGWESWHEESRDVAVANIANQDPYFDNFRYFDITLDDSGTPTLNEVT